MQYKRSSSAAKEHVSDKYVRTLKQLREEASSGTEMNALNQGIQKNDAGKSPSYIKEAGVYELAFGSKMPQAVKFREWVVDEVLPSIRKTGKYVKEKQMSLMNETDLHYKVVEFIRRFWMEAIIVPGLGELQDTSTKRVMAWRKGYTKGQPDILILNRTRRSAGLAIELKTPLGCGVTSPNQEEFLDNLKDNNIETLVSNCYDEIIVKILEYRMDVRKCIRRQKS